MKYSAFMLVAACGLLSACAESGPRYAARDPKPVAQYAQWDYYLDRVDRGRYNRYEEREPCQHYRAIPRNSVEQPDCRVTKMPPLPPVAMIPPPLAPALQPIIRSYALYFDFDKSNIRPDQNQMVDRIVKDLDTYKPTQVTVTGFTDTAGPASYNQRLSERRAHTVGQALTNRGVDNFEVSQSGRGESDLAVQTKNGVPEQANRRAIVDFRALVQAPQPLNQ